MKSLFIVLAMFTSLSATAGGWDPQICTDRVYNYEWLRNLTQDRFNVGEVTRIDVAAAELALLKAQYECGRIGIALYCGASKQQATYYRDGVVEEARVGQRTSLEVIEAYDRYYQILNECK
jgi:hypothetical protein